MIMTSDTSVINRTLLRNHKINLQFNGCQCSGLGLLLLVPSGSGHGQCPNVLIDTSWPQV